MTALRALKRTFSRYYSWDPGYSKGLSSDTAYRFRFGRILIIIVGPFFLGYAVHFCLMGDLLPAGLMLYGAVTSAVGIAFAATTRGTRAWERHYYLFLFLGFLLPLVLVHLELIWVEGRLDYLGWVSLYPLLALFLLGEKKGIAAILPVLVILGILFASTGARIIGAVDVANMKVQFGLALVVSFFISALYERTRKITEDRLLSSETSLRESNAALQNANEESQRLARAAEHANRVKSEFLANMSHELRTPLNHIIGFTDLVLEGSTGSLNDSQKEYLQDVAFSGRHLLSLIGDILDLSKVEANKLELHLAEVALVPLLERCVVMVRQKAAKHGIEVSVDLGKAPTRVRADELRLRQIVYNLLSNAVKFTPDGGRVSIRVWGTDPVAGGAGVELAVSDTGIGMEEVNLERIFMPFEQVQGAAGEQSEGTGLGLSLSRRLVELHRGRIWAESEGLGKGSTFHVVLPIC